MTELARIVEALLFLTPEPVAVAELAEACEADADEVVAALGELGEALSGRGVFLREVAGGWTLATDPAADEAARRLLARPRTPPPLDLRHMAMPRVSVADRLAHLRSLLSRRSGRFSFDEAVQGADRVTVAVTLFALLELYKNGEAAWEQEVPFGPITVVRA